MSNNLVPIVLLFLGLHMAAVGEEKQTETSERTKQDARQKKRLRDLVDDSVHWYKLRNDADSKTAMEPSIVMRWPNNVRGAADGASVVWVADGRPEAIASIYIWEGKINHEFDSLSRGKIVAHHDKTVVWEPKAAGVVFRPIPDAPPPAKSSTARLRHMKALAGQFSSILLGWSGRSQREQLRLIQRPLYRYEIDVPEAVLDGALFAFVSGTDPESLLVIEAVHHEGVSRWEYAFVRQCSGGLEGRFGERAIWTAKETPEINNRGSTHIVFQRLLDEALSAESTQLAPP